MWLVIKVWGHCSKRWEGIQLPTQNQNYPHHRQIVNKHSRDKMFEISFGDISKFAAKIWALGLPWWRSGWESACQCRGHGFKPWSGKIPHAVDPLGPWATIAEPAHLEPVLRNKRGCDSERPVHHNEEWPPLAATRESPCTETKTQHSHK